MLLYWESCLLGVVFIFLQKAMRKTGLVWKAETCIASLNSNSLKKRVYFLWVRGHVKEEFQLKMLGIAMKRQSLYFDVIQISSSLCELCMFVSRHAALRNNSACKKILGSQQVLWQHFSLHYWSKIPRIKKFEAPFFRKKKKKKLVSGLSKWSNGSLYPLLISFCCYKGINCCTVRQSNIFFLAENKWGIFPFFLFCYCCWVVLICWVFFFSSKGWHRAPWEFLTYESR